MNILNFSNSDTLSRISAITSLVNKFLLINFEIFFGLFTIILFESPSLWEWDSSSPRPSISFSSSLSSSLSSSFSFSSSFSDDSSLFRYFLAGIFLFRLFEPFSNSCNNFFSLSFSWVRNSFCFRASSNF